MELFEGYINMIPAFWGMIASLLWIFSTKATSPWDLWWVPFS